MVVDLLRSGAPSAAGHHNPRAHNSPALHIWLQNSAPFQSLYSLTVAEKLPTN